ncbi:MAG TPA: PKD domain-containing protein [Longimicrobium sp.]|jgi:hypothetical protein
MPSSRRTLALFATAVALAAGCKDGSDPLHPRDGGRDPSAPRLYSSPTTQVKVSCPPKAQLGSTFQCVAWGLDTYGVFTSGTVTSWSTPSTNYSVNSSGQVTVLRVREDTIKATIGRVTGWTLIAARDSAAISSSMTGGVVAPNATCTYTATGQHGAEPFTYSWSVSGPATGSASGNHWTGSATGHFTLTVTATDADGRSGTSSTYVFVVPGGSCPPVL